MNLKSKILSAGWRQLLPAARSWRELRFGRKPMAHNKPIPPSRKCADD
jgi:hypothetical protein